jgi:hypothetical protein
MMDCSADECTAEVTIHSMSTDMSLLVVVVFISNNYIARHTKVVVVVVVVVVVTHQSNA